MGGAFFLIIEWHNVKNLKISLLVKQKTWRTMRDVLLNSNSIPINIKANQDFQNFIMSELYFIISEMSSKKIIFSIMTKNIALLKKYCHQGTKTPGIYS